MYTIRITEHLEGEESKDFLRCYGYGVHVFAFIEKELGIRQAAREYRVYLLTVVLGFSVSPFGSAPA